MTRTAPAVAALALLASACATPPPAPDPGVDATGRWTIVAVDGEPTGKERPFNLEIEPPSGSAQFGCNTGSGPVTVGNGWVVPGEPWIITAAGCPDREQWLHFERKGFRILGEPLAIERRGGTAIRLRNRLGSIDLVPTPPIAPADIVGRWDVESINGVGTPGGPSFRVTISRDRLEGRFGCNHYRAAYVLDTDRFRPMGGSWTEMACELTDPATGRPVLPVPVMTLEDWAFAVLRSGPEVRLRPGGRLSLKGATGTIELRRAG